MAPRRPPAAFKGSPSNHVGRACAQEWARHRGRTGPERALKKAELRAERGHRGHRRRGCTLAALLGHGGAGAGGAGRYRAGFEVPARDCASCRARCWPWDGEVAGDGAPCPPDLPASAGAGMRMPEELEQAGLVAECAVAVDA